MKIALDECIDHGQVGNAQGYGTGYVLSELGRIRRFAHRIAFEAYHGYRPEVVMHLCDNPRCVNVRHLAPGTWDSNNKDRAAKGRSAKSVPSRRKVSQEQAEDIRARYEPRGGNARNGVMALAREYGVDSGVIYNIVKNRTHVA